jgi:hypothetical protein
MTKKHTTNKKSLMERLKVNVPDPVVVPQFQSNTKLMSLFMHGKSEQKSHLPLSLQISNAPDPWSKITQPISNTQSGLSSLRDDSHLFQKLSGNMSFPKRPSTLTSSSQGYFPLSPITKSPPPLGTLTSQLAAENHPKPSNPTETGPLLGTPLLPPYSARSPIEPRSCNSTPNTYFSFLEPFCFPISKSLTLTKPSTGMLGKSNILSCPNLAISNTSRLVTSKTMALETVAPPLKRKRSLDLIAGLTKHLDNGTAESATGKPPNAVTNTCAPTVVGSTCKWNI